MAAFAVDLLGAVLHLDVGELGEGDALAGGGEEADVGDLFGRGAEGGIVAHHDVVAGFAVEDLGDGSAVDGATDGAFDGGLDVGDVDAVAVGGSAVDGVVEVGLADDAEEAEVGDAGDATHDMRRSRRLSFEGLEVGAVELDGELALDAADGFFDVVGDGLREVPDDAGSFFKLAIHGGDELVLVLVEDGPPLLLGLEVDEVFGVEEAGGVGAIVGAAGLADDLGDLGKRGQDEAGLFGDGEAFGGAGTGSERAANPDGAFVEMGKELGADDAAELRKIAQGKQQCGDANGNDLMVDSPGGCRAIAPVSHLMTGFSHSVAPLGKRKLASTGASTMEKMRAPSRAKATVQAMGLKRRPSTDCKVKMGR